MANSTFPGTTGKYVNRPRFRLPGSGSGRSISAGISQSFFPQHLDQGNLQGLSFMRPLCRQTLQLDGKPRNVDAVANGVPLVGGVGHLQEVGDVRENSLLREWEVFLEDMKLLVTLREIDKYLRLQ